LEFTGPDSDRHDLGHRPEPANPPSTGDSELPWEVETVVDLQKQAQRPKVFPGKTLGVNLNHVAERGEALLDLAIVPMLDWKVHDGDKGKPSRNAEETVGGLFRPFEVEHVSIKG
jgi:hypothetical protein